MPAYADYAYYTATYLGSAIAEADFPQLALRASAVIDIVTFDRAPEVTDVDQLDKIKMATCAVADKLAAIAAGEAGGIQSETVGSHSVTYSNSSEMQRSNQQKLENAAYIYLANTGLMFAGLAAGE